VGQDTNLLEHGVSKNIIIPTAPSWQQGVKSITEPGRNSRPLSKFVRVDLVVQSNKSPKPLQTVPRNQLFAGSADAKHLGGVRGHLWTGPYL
jgi:hypothetical protein